MNTRRLVAWIATGILFLPLNAQQGPSDARDKLGKSVDLQHSWSPSNNFPGTARLVAKEAFRERLGEPLVVGYDLFAEGLPTYRAYDVFLLAADARSPDEAKIQAKSLMLRPSGELATRNNEDTIRLILADVSPGEPFRVAVISHQGNYKAFLVLVPDPIEGTDGPCKVRVLRLSQRFELALVEASGFPPRSEVQLSGDSAGEKHTAVLQTDSEGYTDAGIGPFVKGKAKGKMSLQLSSAGCKPKVSFTWGTQWDR